MALAPISASGCRTVVSPRISANSMSSKPITARSRGTSSPAAAAASRTPTAWMSDAAKIAVGGSVERQELRGEVAGGLASVDAVADQALVDGETTRRERLR